MTKREGHQQGPQDHAEGTHGSKTHQAFIQQLHSRANAPVADELESKTEKNSSQRRLTQDRQQHDAAEKKSEKTRLSRDMERGHIKHDPSEPMSRGSS